MNFLQDRKNKLKKRNTINLLLLIVVVFLTARFGFPDFMHSVFSRFFGGVAQTEDSTIQNIENVSKNFLTKKFLISENQKLRDEIDNLNQKLVEYQILKDENQDLKDFIGGFDDIENVKLANVISRPPVSFYDTMIVDLGEDDGIFVGQRVFVNDNMIIGTISDVYKKTSLVSLFSTPNTETKGILVPSNTEINLFGNGGGSFSANIPRDLVVSPGTIVTFPGRQNDILAIALSNISDPRDPLNTVLFRSPVNFNNIHYVGIKLNEN